MEFKNLALQLPENPNAEIQRVVAEMKLLPLVEAIQREDIQGLLPPDVVENLASLLTTITDMFSMEVPDVSQSPEETLRRVSRDVNISRILRERGLFRLYQFCRTLTEDGVPVYLSLMNPETEAPFENQEKFIGWFCREASISRGLVFMRLAAIERTLSLGYTESEAFQIITARPYAIQETLKLVGEWTGGSLDSVNPEALRQVAERVAPELAEGLANLSAAFLADPSDENKEALFTGARPIMKALLEEVSGHASSKDAMSFIKHDILEIPEINYTWDTKSDALVVELVRMGIDSATGTKNIVEVISVPFYADIVDLPREIVDDLIRRLPIRNRQDVV